MQPDVAIPFLSAFCSKNISLKQNIRQEELTIFIVLNNLELYWSITYFLSFTFWTFYDISFSMLSDKLRHAMCLWASEKRAMISPKSWFYKLLSWIEKYILIIVQCNGTIYIKLQFCVSLISMLLFSDQPIKRGTSNFVTML